MSTATAGEAASRPDDFAAELAQLLAFGAFSLPRHHAVVLLEHLRRTAEATGYPRAELLPLLEHALERTRNEPAVFRAVRRLLRVPAGGVQHELQRALRAWLTELSWSEIDELLPVLALSMHSRFFDEAVDAAVSSRLEREYRLRFPAELAGQRELDERLRTLQEELARREDEGDEMQAALRDADRQNTHLREEVAALRGRLESTMLEQSELRDRHERLVVEWERMRAESGTSGEKSEPPALPDVHGEPEAAPPEELEASAGLGSEGSERGGEAESVPDSGAEPHEKPQRHVETGFAENPEPGGWIDPKPPSPPGSATGSGWRSPTKRCRAPSRPSACRFPPRCCGLDQS